MKIILNIFILCLSMHTARASTVVRAECSLFDLSGKILKKYPGYYCAFLKDGSWVSMGIESLSYYSPTDELIWQKIKPYHHMVKADFSEKYIVALSEEGKDVFGCNTRFDTVEKIELKTGKELKYSLVDIVKKINFSSVSLFIKKIKIKFENKTYDCDTTHVNSISQISTENSNARMGLVAGDWLVNLRGWDTLISLDVNSGKLSAQFRSKNLIDSHDIHMFDRNNFLIYFNSMPELSGMNYKTQIASMNVSTGEVTRLSPKRLDFYQTTWGGVQKIDNDWLISYYDKHGYSVNLLDKDFKVKNHFIPFPSKDKVGTGFQDAKIVNLESFLKNYRGVY